MNLRLIKISARNFKGQNFDRDLPLLVTLIGSNWAGKSSRTDAIRLLLLGYLPELGKTNRATFALASGRVMEVSGVLSDGRRLSRTWTLRGDAVKAEAFGFEDFATDEGEAESVATMLDATTYFERSSPDRIAYVFGLIPPGDLPTPESILTAISDGIRAAVPNWTAEKLTPLLDLGREEARKHRRAPQAFLESYQTAIEDLAKLKRAETARFEKTIQGLTQLRSADAEGRAVAEVKAELAEAEGAYQKVAEELRPLRAKEEGAAYAGRARERLLAGIAAAEKAAGSLPALQAEVARLRAEVTAAAAAPRIDPDATSRKLTELRIEYARSGERFRAISKTVAEVSKTAAGIDALTACPFCGAAGDGWKILKRAELDSRLKDLGAQLAEEEKALPALAREVEGLEAALTKGREESRLHSLRTAALEAAERKESDARAAAEKAADLTRQLAEIPVFTADSAQQIEALVAREQAALSRIRILRDELSNANAKALEVSRLADAEKAREEASAAAALSAAAAGAIRAEKERLVELAFAPLLRRANDFLGRILSTPIAYRDGEIGTIRAGMWIGHRTLSGTEKALVYASIQVALAEKSPVRIVILDELGRLDDANARAVDEAVKCAVLAGRISQYVGIDAGRGELHREFMTVEEVGS